LLSLLENQYAVSAVTRPSGDAHGFVPPENSASQSPIQNLIRRIKSLVAKRALPRGAANALIAELDVANHQPDTGNPIIKVNLLGHFVERVSDLVKTQEISEEEGQPLIDAADIIINLLSA
jgi:hypothetical protein